MSVSLSGGLPCPLSGSPAEDLRAEHAVAVGVLAEKQLRIHTLDQQAVTWCFAVDYLEGADFTISKPDNYELWRTLRLEFWPGPQLGWEDLNPENLEVRYRAIFDSRPASSGVDVGTFWLYRRIGYNARVLFLAHFDWEVVKSSFKFGVFEMLGSAAWAGGQAAEIAITQTRLINYAEIWGNWVLAQNFVFAFSAVSTLSDGAMASISEAISHGRKILSQYYAVMVYKWGGLVSAFLAAVLLAVGPRFILGASGPDFVRAANYAVPLLIWGAIQYPSWVGDNVQLGSNKPYLKSTLVAGEQIIRIVLAWVLLQRFQVAALVIAYFVGLLTKDFVAYFVNHRLCFPHPGSATDVRLTPESDMTPKSMAPVELL